MLVGIDGEVIFLLALLADEQQRALACVEAFVLQRLLNEFCFSGVQKAGEGIDGNGHGSLLTRRTGRRVPFRPASSR